ncbi:MAG: endonuclease domain-containing protein [Bacteroidota bacterium]|nr:endonuclease domain-containing protein [Bacteroidota bacterium]
MKTQLFNRTELKKNRRALRNNLTSSEATLWLLLKNKQLDGRRFRRQYSVGSYILDFYCPSEKLAIELDGAHHFTPEGLENDRIRDEYLNSLGIRVLRIENKLVFEIQEQVLNYIREGFKK